MVTKKCTHVATALAAALLFAAAPAAADDPPSADDPSPAAKVTRPPEAGPAVHHAPISSATEDEPLTVTATIDAPHLVKGAYVVYRAKDRWLSLRLLRSGEEGEYAGVIPAEHVKGPRLGYAIELERMDGAREPVFASRAELHPVLVHDDPTDERERWLLDRLGGRRSVVSATGELVRFGTTVGKFALPCAANQEDCPVGSTRVPTVDDQYWRVDASYTYRPLRTVSEFGFRLGVVRGRSLVDLSGVRRPTRYDVGLNYAGANVRFRLADILHADLEVHRQRDRGRLLDRARAPPSSSAIRSASSSRSGGRRSASRTRPISARASTRASISPRPRGSRWRRTSR
jgi:hypothetical protein